MTPAAHLDSTGLAFSQTLRSRAFTNTMEPNDKPSAAAPRFCRVFVRNGTWGSTPGWPAASTAHAQYDRKSSGHGTACRKPRARSDLPAERGGHRCRSLLTSNDQVQFGRGRRTPGVQLKSEHRPLSVKSCETSVNAVEQLQRAYAPFQSHSRSRGFWASATRREGDPRQATRNGTIPSHAATAAAICPALVRKTQLGRVALPPEKEIRLQGK